MDPMEWRLPGVMRCAGNGCNSDPGTWPLHYARHGDVFNRLCSSCVILSYRSMYCCGCFFLLGPAPPAHNDDPLVAPHEETVTCLVCHEAVAHLSCIDYSTIGVFVCPICRAAATGRPFSYAPSCKAPLNVRGARVVLLSTRIALTLLEKEAAHAQAVGEQMAVESAQERKEAYHALSLALGIDTEAPSMNRHIPQAKNLGKEPQTEMVKPRNLGKEPQIDMAKPKNLGNEPQIDMAKPKNLGKEPQIDMAKPKNLDKEPQIDMAKLDLNKPHIDMAKLDLNELAPPPSPATSLEVCMERIGGETAISSEEPRPPSMVRFTFGMDGLRREPAVASSEPPPPKFIFGTQGIGRESTMASTEPPLASLARLTLGTEGVCRELTTASKLYPPRPKTLQLLSKDYDEEDEE